MNVSILVRRLFRLGVEAPCLGGLLAPPKPRVRVRQDGWISHPPGRPFPFNPMTIVETQMRGGLTATGPDADYARVWHDNFWLGRAQSWKHNIVAYRIVAFASDLIPSQCPVWPDPRRPAGQGELT